MDINLLDALIASALRLTTPIALGAVGASVCERAGLINIGIEGMMLIGGFVGAVGSEFLGGPWQGLLAGTFAGAFLGAVMALFCVYMNGDQIVFGIGVNLLGLGASTLGLFLIWGNRGTSGWLEGLPHVVIPVISEIPLLGSALSGHDPTTYICWFLVPFLYVVMYRTAFGLRLRAAGEHPQAVETVGLNVYRLRTVGTLVSGALSGLAGVSMTLGVLNLVSHNVTAGRGFLAFAANMVGGWHPVGAFAGSLIFGILEAVRMRLLGIVPPQILQMLPYIATLLILTLSGSRTQKPAALGAEFPHPISQWARRGLGQDADEPVSTSERPAAVP
jgi:ABC-type uncharacterized transport system permease subunit